MTRPPCEVADVIRLAGSGFWKRYRESLTWAQVKVLYAIVRCRTAALGGHRDQCVRCGYQAISYNSCLIGVNYYFLRRQLELSFLQPRVQVLFLSERE